MNYDVIVAGAGMAGAVSARIMAEKGRKVLIVEKKKQLAGNCHDYKNEYGITVHTYGPHIFHTNNSAVWNFLNRFTDFEFYQHRVLAYAEGKMIPFPINVKTINSLFETNINVGQVESFLKEQVENSKFNSEIVNFRDAVVSQVGERLYETFFKNYTAKQWGRDPEELSPEIARRIPVRKNGDNRYFSDIYQGIPKSGYSRMFERIVDHENIDILLGADYFEARDHFHDSLTIYTGKLDEYFDFKYGELEYRSLKLEFKSYENSYVQPAATVNYPNDYDWTRITEFKHFLKEDSSHTTLCYEYPASCGDPYYVVMTPENDRKREMYMEDAMKLETGKQTVFVGRLAQYRYYNMDQVIEKAMEKCGNI